MKRWFVAVKLDGRVENFHDRQGRKIVKLAFTLADGNFLLDIRGGERKVRHRYRLSLVGFNKQNLIFYVSGSRMILSGILDLGKNGRTAEYLKLVARNGRSFCWKFIIFAKTWTIMIGAQVFLGYQNDVKIFIFSLRTAARVAISLLFRRPKFGMMFLTCSFGHR